MSIEVRLYGDLKKLVQTAKETNPGSPHIESLGSEKISDVSDILQKFGIRENQVSHIFVNGKYSNAGKKLKDEDRIGLFPKNMGLLYKWYFQET